MAARSPHTPRRAETREVPACRAPPRHRERAASWSSTAAAPRASSPPLDLLHPHLLPLLHPLVTRPSPFCLAVHTRFLHDPSRPAAAAAAAVRRHDPLPTPTAPIVPLRPPTLSSLSRRPRSSRRAPCAAHCRSTRRSAAQPAPAIADHSIGPHPRAESAACLRILPPRPPALAAAQVAERRRAACSSSGAFCS